MQYCDHVCKIRDHVGCRTVELSYTRIYFVKKVKYIIYTTTTCYIHTQETRSKDSYICINYSSLPSTKETCPHCYVYTHYSFLLPKKSSNCFG